jgi:hypothetical protein
MSRRDGRRRPFGRFTAEASRPSTGARAQRERLDDLRDDVLREERFVVDRFVVERFVDARFVEARLVDARFVVARFADVLRVLPPPARRLRVAAAFLPARLRVAVDWLAAPLRPPFFELARDSGFPRPEPDFLPPPDSLFTVAHARASASFVDVPRFR